MLCTRLFLIAVLMLAATGAQAQAEDPPSAVGPVMKLLRGGKVPATRIPAIVEIVGTRGNEHDLGFLLTQAVGTDWSVEVRQRVLNLLVEAVETRKVIPDGDLSVLGKLALNQELSTPMRSQAIRLIDVASVKAAAPDLAALLDQKELPAEVQGAALKAYVSLAGKDALPAISKVLSSPAPVKVQGRALSALVELDPVAAARSAVTILSTFNVEQDIGPIVDAFLARKVGTDALAEAVTQSPPRQDIAKLALRHMYSTGRSDQTLVDALSKAAGLNEPEVPVTPEYVASLVKDVEISGNPERGELVFRRADLSCTKCHAVSGGGGQIGPDLSAVGSISPVEFLVTSVLVPDAAIKEAYVTRVVATADGRVLQGILVDRTQEKLVLREANGQLVTIALEDIDDEIEGKSLMPKGLVKFMTRQELVDLIAFLSHLGRPGDYSIRTTARLQRYQVLASQPESLQGGVPNDEQFEAEISKSSAWVPFYAKVNGQTPLPELVKASGNPVVYLRGEFDVRAAGEVQLKIAGPKGMAVWLDDDALTDPAAPVHVESGRHRVTLRIDTRPSGVDIPVVIELLRPMGSVVEFQVVDGA